MKNLRGVARVSMRAIWAIVLLLAGLSCRTGDGENISQHKYRGLLGLHSKKVRIENGRTWLWAGGDPSEADSQWYDFTGSSIPTAELQFGIGKDRIRAIDDPLFVSPDDPSLRNLAPRADEDGPEPKSNDEIRVIGLVVGQHARAYPVALLNHHELVNDSFGSEAIGVGW